MVRLANALDDVLARVAAGESRDAAVERYPNMAVELAELLDARNRLSALPQPPAVTADTTAARRRQFLATARAYQQQSAAAQPPRRFLAWVWPRQRAGQPALWPALARAAIVAVLALGIVGGTVAAAQSSLPDSPLYRVKLAIENTRLELAQDPARQTTLAMSLASVRIREMERLAIADRPISTEVTARLQTHLDAALDAARQAPEPEMARLLEQVRTMAREQQRALVQAQVSAPRGASSHAALSLAEQAVTRTQQRAEAGLANPDAFRYQFGRGQDVPVEPTPRPTATGTPQPARSTTTPQPAAAHTSTATPTPARTPLLSHTPQASATPQREQAGTPQPSTSEPGPQATNTPEQAGPGPEPTPDQAGPGPQPTGTPTDGSGTGSGTGGNGDPGSGGGTRRP